MPDDRDIPRYMKRGFHANPPIGPTPEGYWEGFRDWGAGTPRPEDIVYDPKCNANQVQAYEDAKKRLDPFFCLLQEFFQRSVIFSKDPAYVQRPWFGKPLIKTIFSTVAGGTVGTLFDYTFRERTRAIVTMMGIDVDNIAALMAGALTFWFEKGDGDQTEIVPFFDDQSTAGYGGGAIESGKTTVLPGSVEIPFNFLEAGLQQIIIGPTRLRFRVDNQDVDPAVFRGVLGFYSYWMPYGATQDVPGEVQM